MEQQQKPSRKVRMSVGLFEKGLTILNVLKQTYPKCFFEPGKEKPLKKGILLDLLQASGLSFESPSYQAITAAINIYTSTLSYRVGLIREDAVRIDLEGNEVEPINLRERTQAKIEKMNFEWKLSMAEAVMAKDIRKQAGFHYARDRKRKEAKKATMSTVEMADKSDVINTEAVSALPVKKETMPKIVFKKRLSQGV